MEEKVPYIVGTFTEFHFKKMASFLDYMLTIDPDHQQIRDRFYDVKDAMCTHYLKNWKPIVLGSEERNEDNKLRVNLADNPFITKRNNRLSEMDAVKSALYPYQAKLERGMSPHLSDFNDWDTVWAHGDLCSPGRHQYFIVYKLDEHRTFKT
jgi:glycogen synthase